MKMLAMLASKLTNSAKCFSTFANADYIDVKGKFGTEGSNMWKPWNYKQRVNVVNKVNAFKKRIAVEKNFLENKEIQNYRLHCQVK